MVTHDQVANVSLGVSAPSAFIAWFATALPVIQSIAAIVAIIAGLVSIIYRIRE